MFHTILVPLDGSLPAERALEPAFGLAEKFGSQVTLLRVVVAEPSLAALPYMGAPRHVPERAGFAFELAVAKDYLAGIRAAWLGRGVQVRCQVLHGAPPEQIIGAAEDGGAGLIVMSTHGRSGLGRLIYGSVAEAVLRGARVPVLLIPPDR